MFRRPIIPLAALCLLTAVLRAADRPPLNDLLPQDTLAFAEIDTAQAPPSPAGAPQSNSLIDLGLGAMQSLGVLPTEAGMVADVLGLAGEIGGGQGGGGGRRNCVALLDADIKATPAGAIDCKSVQLVCILETDKPAEMIERLTRLLTHASTRVTVRQSIHRAAEGKKEYVEFWDTRWPEWLKLAWTQESGGGGGGAAETNYGSRFILTLGAGAMDHYLADRPVGEVPWKRALADADAAQPAAPGNLLARAFVAPRTFRERFPEPMAKTSMGRLFAALDLASADACTFTARVNGRAISLADATAEKGRTSLTPWTVNLPPDAPLLKAIPEDASGYAVLNMQWPLMYDRLMSLLNAILTDPTDEPIEKVVADLARKQNVDIRKDILDRLQPLVLVHDSPQHPLRLPLMVTAVGAAQPGMEEKVKTAITKLTAAAAAEIDKKASPTPGPEPAPKPAAAAPGDFTRLRIRTDSDGTSYLQFGLVGPGWGWVQNRLIVSWSPGAVRANAPAAARVTSSAFAPPSTKP